MRANLLTPQDNPHNISLFYTTKGDFVTITLDLSQSKFSLTTDEQQTIAELPLKRESCMITAKKVILVTIRDVLLDATTLITEILASHITKNTT